MVVPLLVLAGAACSLKPGMSLRRTVNVPGTAAGWNDVTDQFVAALPPVPSALATVRAPSGCRLALIDPAILAVGPACDVAPRRLWGETVSLAVRDGSPLLPCSARLLVLGDGDRGLPAGAVSAGSSVTPPRSRRRSPRRARFEETTEDIASARLALSSTPAKVFSASAPPLSTSLRMKYTGAHTRAAPDAGGGAAKTEPEPAAAAARAFSASSASTWLLVRR